MARLSPGIAPTAMDAGGSRLLQAVADGFRVLQRLTSTIPVDPNMTGEVYRHCYFLGCDQQVDQLGPITIGFSETTATYVSRGFIGFNLNGVLPETAQITKATLTLKATLQREEPFLPEHLGSLALERMDYGPKLDSSDFGLNALGGVAGCGFSFSGPPNPVDGPINVLNYLQTDWNERTTRGYRSQYRLRFANNSPRNGRGDPIISYNQNPTLTIEYLIP